MFLYVAEVEIDGEVEADWGAGENEQEAEENILVRLCELNDWTKEEASSYLQFSQLWQVDEIDGYKVTLEKIRK